MYLRILIHQRKRHNSLVDRSDQYIVLSESFKELLKEYYSIESDKIIAIPNVKNDFEQYNLKLNLIKRKQVLFVGRLTQQKGINYLIDIWNIIEHRTKEYELIIIGEGEERKTIERKISDFDLRRVKLIGYREDVYKYYNDSSVLFLTSVYEGFGLVLPEAMQFGVVPFAFNSYMALKDIIRDNVDGYTIEPFNIQEYADTFLSFIQKTPEEVLKVRLCAIESSRRFSKDTILSQWKSII
jgi:glycosyltransferase involved in cell wall biosynthesis